ncbi:MAG TPA: ribonucleoside triphosphate reductase, partial [Firmicutes bacterium]|nr:ribonucleoside triphosphate reductase [Bacillota bacterium]
SSHLPVDFTDDIFKALDIQDGLQTLYTSGTVFHAFLGQKLPSYKSCMNLVRKIAENYHIPYYTMSPTYSVCKEHGYLDGEQYVCPKCGSKTEVYSRITGYYRPIQNWNDGKTEEYKNRKEYNLKNSHLTHDVNKDLKIEEEQKCEECCDTKVEEALLFGTKTCPNCKMAKMLLDKAHIKYQFVDAEENVELAKKFNVKKAPTLIVPAKDGYSSFENASNIKGYIESLKK